MSEKIACARCGRGVGVVEDKQIICEYCLEKQEKQAKMDFANLVIHDKDFPALLKKTVAEGVEWMTWKQNPKAMVGNHGIGKVLRRFPKDIDGYGGSVFFVQVMPSSDSEAIVVFDASYHDFDEHDVEMLRSAITPLGHPIVDGWNGLGCHTASFRIERKKGSRSWKPARDMMDVYSKGCPKHKTVFCGWQGHTKAEKNCTWYSDCYKLAKIPEGW